MTKNINCLCSVYSQLSDTCEPRAKQSLRAILLSTVLFGLLLPRPLYAMPGPDTVRVTANANQFETYTPLREDANNNVWVLNFAFHPGANIKYLSEFDGRKWRDYPLPDHTALGINSKIALDDADNVWVMSLGPGPGDTSLVGVFDHAHKSWRCYDTLEDALAGEKSRRPKTFTLGRFPTQSFMNEFHPIVLGNQICYLALDSDGAIHVHYYDGTHWMRWKHSEVTGMPTVDTIGMGSPFFDPSGVLCIDEAVPPQPGTKRVWPQPLQTYRYVAGKWALGTYTPPAWDMTDAVRAENALVMSFPEPRPDYDQIITDRLGNLWYLRHGALYHSIDGIEKPVLPTASPTLFAGSRLLAAVLIDKSGNAFVIALRNGMSWPVCFFIKAPYD